MFFLFLMGVEGTGHHMIRALIKEFLDNQHVLDVAKCEWHKMLIDHWDPEKSSNLRFGQPLEKLTCKKSLKRQLLKVFEEYHSKGGTHIFEPASFPFGQPRNALRRPDFVEFVDWYKDTLKIRPLVLYRDPVSTTYSAIRRNFTDNWKLQAKIVEDNFLFIEKQIQVFPQMSVRVLVYEEFTAAPEKYMASLAAWWQLDEIQLRKGICNLKQPTPKNSIPDKYREPLEAFFSHTRMSQWAGIHSTKMRLEGV